VDGRVNDVVRGDLRSPCILSVEKSPIKNILPTLPELTICKKALGMLPEDGNLEMIVKVHEGIVEHGRQTIHNVSFRAGLSYATCQHIRADELNCSSSLEQRTVRPSGSSVHRAATCSSTCC
jgi:hypothetical protein